jgi:hypothetical protein
LLQDLYGLLRPYPPALVAGQGADRALVYPGQHLSPEAETFSRA